MHRHLGRVGPRDEIRRPDQVEEVLTADPLSTSYELVLHHGDMSGGAAERRDA